MELAAAAVAAGAPQSGPEAAQAAAVLAGAYAAALGREDGPAFRAWLLDRFAAHHDPRAERYWELVARIQGGGSRDRGAADAFEWLVGAIRTAGGA